MHDEHLRKHLRDGEHLKHHALAEFVSAIRTGRLIAFVGSYATEEMGYESWKVFLGEYAGGFKRRGSRLATLMEFAKQRILDEPASSSTPASATTPSAAAAATPAGTAASATASPAVETAPASNSTKTALIDIIVENWLANSKEKRGGTAYLKLREALYSDAMFGLDRADHSFAADSTPVQIIEALGIERVITTNYDLEFEWQMMLTAQERIAAKEKRAEKFATLITKKTIARDDNTGGLSRRMPSGRIAHSDVFSRKRTDRLFDFAIGSSGYDGHILHLHGRATKDDEERLVVGLGDYEQQYRRSGITKLPFEHALRLLYAGNPVIFIGSGMEEAEVTNTLENFVSDVPRRRLAPAFVLWSPSAKEADPNEIQMTPADHLRRLEWYRRFGVLTIYDCELKGQFDAAESVALWDAAGQPRRLTYAVNILGEFAGKEIVPFEWRREHLRSVQPRYDKNGEKERRIDIWRCKEMIPDEDRFLSIFKKGKVRHPKPGKTLLSSLKDSEFFITLFRGAPVKAIVDRPGEGHGYLAKVIAHAFSENLHDLGLPVRASLVNAGFISEIDSTFALISGLYDGQTAFGRVEDPQRPNPVRKGDPLLPDSMPMSRQAMLRGYEHALDEVKRGEAPLARHLLLVINGMDRFFDTSGYPLSNELDNMMRKIVQAYRHGSIHDLVEHQDTVNPYTVILLGSRRVQRYLEDLGWTSETEAQKEGKHGDFAILSDEYEPGHKLLETIKVRNTRRWGKRESPLTFGIDSSVPPPDERVPGEHSNYLALLAHHMKIDLSIARTTRIKLGRERSIGDFRHNVLAALLRSDSIEDALKHHKWGKDVDPDLCLDILSSLAFFGEPVESCVLAMVPRIDERFEGLPSRKREKTKTDAIEKAIGALVELRLVMQFLKFPGSPVGWHRYGVHRTVMAELRNRYGVPISEAKLSAGFNLSLYASQLIDDYTPQPDIHRELGEMINCLTDECDAMVKKSEQRLVAGRGAARAEPAAYLRAVMLLMRSYFTTSALLMLEPPPPPFEDHNAPLTDHAMRIERLIKAAEKLAHTRHPNGSLSGTRPAKLAGAETFLPDDLVWLHNEYGVIKLVQGDLYKARFAFNSAQKINRKHVEYEDELQNWRRIQLNQLHLDIERAKISRAEGRILELERAVDRHVKMYRIAKPQRIISKAATPSTPLLVVSPDEPADRTATVVEEIVERYGRKTHERTRVVDPDFPADAILTAGLITGYRGFCAYLRGNFEVGLHQLEVAVELLRNIGEHRASAIFLRYRASLLTSIGDHGEALECRKFGLAAADSVRQMDLAFLYRVDGVAAQPSIPPDQYPAALQQIMAALHYSVLADMYRVRIESRKVLAEMRFLAGDYDGALEHAADALAVASRFGFSLRKITLRILIGKILIRRGDPDSGNALLDGAIFNADRVGFQRAVEQAQQVRYKDSQLYRP